jgi:hypothetical protein
VGLISFYDPGFLFLLSHRRHPRDDPLAYHDSCRRRVDCSVLRYLGSPSSTREVFRGLGGHAYTPTDSYRSEGILVARIHCLAYCVVDRLLCVLVRIEYPKRLLITVTRGLVCFSVFLVPKDSVKLDRDRMKGVLPHKESHTVRWRSRLLVY